MIMKNRLAIAAMAALVVVSAGAQQGKRTPWTKEPTAVFGLRLGEPIKAEDVPDCGGVANATEPARFGFCRMASAADHISVAAFPIREFGDGRITIEDGIASELTIMGRHQDYGDMREVLVERYGPPTTSVRDKVQSRAGAAFPSETALWVGKRITITLSERAGTVDTSAVTFSHIASTARAEEQRKSNRKSDAAKM